MTTRSFLLILSLVWITASCSQKSTRMDEPIMEPQATGDRAAVAPLPKDEPGGDLTQLDTAFFPTDSAKLGASAKKALKENAEWLKKNPAAKIQVEGHCDERGTDEYNLKLGQRRADATKAYLVSLGVAPSRITTVSYGRVPGMDYDKNRRAAFIIIQP